MANTINVTDLAVIVAGAITTGQQVTIYDQSGNAGRAAIEDVVAAAQDLNGCVCVKTVEIDLTSAEILTLNTAPVLAIPAPAANQYIEVIGVVCEYTYGTSDYTSGILIGPTVGPQFYLSGTLIATGSRFVKGVPTIPTSPDSNVAYASPIYIYANVNPTGGDGTMVIRLTYMVHTRTI